MNIIMSKKVIVDLLERTGALAICRYLNRRYPLILMYHRILKHELIPGIHPEIFSEQMAFIKKHFTVLNMSQLFTRLTQGNLPPRALVLTFDDGHYDFYTNAWPIIREHGLTATLFITTDFIDQKRWLWPDLIRYELMNAEPGEFVIQGFGKIRTGITDILPSWNRLGDFCLTLSSEERDLFVRNLASQLKVAIPEAPQPPFTPTTWPQLSEMIRDGLDIGSHSVTHPIFSKINSTQLLMELQTSKERIREKLNIDPIGICYPNGMPTDISSQVEEEARRYYHYGVVAYPKKFSADDLMKIGRIGVPNDITRFKIKTSYLSRPNNIGEYK